MLLLSVLSSSTGTPDLRDAAVSSICLICAPAIRMGSNSLSADQLLSVQV